MERGGLTLRDFLDLAEELGRRRLIDADFLLHMQDAYGLEKSQSAQSYNLGGVFRHIERNFDMALSREIVYLIRLNFGYDPHQRRRVGHVAVMKFDAALLLHVAHPSFKIQVLDPAGVETGTAAYDAMHSISFCEQEFCQITAVLTCYSCDKGYFIHVLLFIMTKLVQKTVTSKFLACIACAIC